MEQHSLPTVEQHTATIGISALEPGAQALVRQLVDGRVTEIVVTRDNQPIAVIRSPTIEPCALWGALAGTVTIPAHGDLTEPADEDWMADA